MSTDVKMPTTELDAEYEAAVDRAMNLARDPVAMDKAAREMDEGREEIRSRLGELDLAIELIRDARDA